MDGIISEDSEKEKGNLCLGEDDVIVVTLTNNLSWDKQQNFWLFSHH